MTHNPQPPTVPRFLLYEADAVNSDLNELAGWFQVLAERAVEILVALEAVRVENDLTSDDDRRSFDGATGAVTIRDTLRKIAELAERVRT